MSLFKCSGCDYTSYSKRNAERHINRKIKCADEIELITVQIEIKCEFCNKTFSTKEILKSHISKTCKVLEKNKSKEIEILRIKNKELEIENKILKENPKTVINNNNNNSINNTIILVNGYNDTNLEKLSDKHYLRALNKMIMSVPTFIKDVHFNPNMPENQNIYISNMRNGFVMVYNSETKNWDARPKGEMIDRLINDREYDIQEWLGCEKYPKAMQKFNEYIEKKEEDGVQKTIKEEVELVLYNNRNLIMNK